MIRPETIRVPSSCSPLEGVYLLAVLIRGQQDLATQLRRGLGDAELSAVAGLFAGTRELWWRLRVILGTADPGPAGAAASMALLELAGLGATFREEVHIANKRSPARLLECLGENLKQVESVARQCLCLFAGGVFVDEFRLVGELAVEQGQRLGSLRLSTFTRDK